jgi:hypothetical protein
MEIKFSSLISMLFARPNLILAFICSYTGRGDEKLFFQVELIRNNELK